MPNHSLPLPSSLPRSAAGIRTSRSGDFSGWNMPSICAFHNRAASTSRITSAGLLAPSLRKRSRIASSPASMRLILMPVCFVNSAYRFSSVW